MLGFMIGSLLSMLHYAVGEVFWPGTWVGASFNCIPQFGGSGDYTSIGGVVVWTLCLGGAVVYATGWQGVSPYGFLLVWGHILCSTVRQGTAVWAVM